jgi:hypothetical protein
MDRVRASCAREGTTAERNIQRQPWLTLKKTAPTMYERTCPKVMSTTSRVTRRPRRLAGQISAKYTGLTLDARPYDVLDFYSREGRSTYHTETNDASPKDQLFRYLCGCLLYSTQSKEDGAAQEDLLSAEAIRKPSCGQRPNQSCPA